MNPARRVPRLTPWPAAGDRDDLRPVSAPGTSTDPGTPLPGGRNRSGAVPPSAASAPDTICSICDQPILHVADGRCWLGPDRISSAAHRACLLRIGETDLGLTS